MIHFIAVGQEKNKAHYLGFDVGFNQIKEGQNYGVVFSGLNVGLDYQFEWRPKKHLFTYAFYTSFAPSYGIGIGINWRLKFFDLNYAYDLLKSEKFRFYLGAGLQSDLNWQLYPELQSGHMLWNASYDFSSLLKFDFPIKEQKFSCSFKFVWLGVLSRPDESVEVHSYSLKFSDFFSNAYKNMKFSHFLNYHKFQFDLAWNRVKGKNFSFGYRFEYIGNNEVYAFQMIQHTMRFNWVLVKKKKSKK